MNKRITEIRIEPTIGMSTLLVLFSMVLAVCKMMGYLTISWWWVFAPIWIGPALFLGFFGLLLAFVLILCGSVFLFMVVAAGMELYGEWSKGRNV